MNNNLKHLGTYICVKPYTNEYSGSQRLYQGDTYQVYFEKGVDAKLHDVYYIYFNDGSHSCNQCITFFKEHLIELASHRNNTINNLLKEP